MDPNLRAAVLSANTIQAPAPVFQATQAPELAALNTAGFRLPQSSGATSALANQSEDVVRAQKEAEARAEAERKANAKYQRIPKKDGGFGFLDPDGNEISAAEYARATGKSINEVLKDSYNPIDKAFIQDHKQLEQYINDKANAKNDPKARSRAQAVETQIRKLYKIDMHKQDPNSVMQAFIAAYPTVFGHTQKGKQGLNTLFPSNNTLNKKRSSVGGGGGIPG